MMNLRIADLVRYGAPRKLVEWWEGNPGGKLLPLQEQAVREGALFSGLSLILRGPTASGKSFAGEMAAACSAFRGRRAVLLSPLRSLAEEQYERLRERYGPLGCRVILATREHRAQDRDFRRGRFDLAVAVTEKFLGLAAADPALPRMVGTVVADELDLLADPDRGCALALALETARRAHCRIVGLAGVLPWTMELARNLGGRVIQSEIRPVPLCLGTLRNGRFRYRIPPDRTCREEEFPELEGKRFESREEMLIETVRTLGSRGERCLIFTRSRMEAVRLAARLAAESPWPCAREAFDEAVALPGTHHRDLLLQTLTGGVAFHSGDLTPEERRVVERAFRQGALRVVCATATLAWGVNLPADNVLLPAEKWVAGSERGLPWKVPLPLWERVAMAGRAGRPRAEGPGFGRAIFVAASLFEAESLWDRYVAPEAARTEGSALFSGPAPGAEAGALLSLAATAGCCGKGDVVGFFARWFPRLGERRHGGSPAADRALECCVRGGLIVPSPPAGRPGGSESSFEPVFSLTPVGRVSASRGITPATVSTLSGWLRERGEEPWSQMEALAVLFLTEDGERSRVPAGRAGSDWSELAERLRSMSESVMADGRDPLADLIIRCQEQELRAARAGRAAEAVALWMAGRSLPEIEGITGLTAGTVLELRDTAAWLADAAASLAEALKLPEGVGVRLRSLERCVRLGLPGELDRVVEVLEAAGVRVEREALLTLWKRAPLGDPLEQLAWAVSEGIVPAAWLEAVCGASAETGGPQKGGRFAGKPDRPRDPESAVVLVIDDRRPDRVLWRGRPVALQKRQYDLLRLLACHAGECVPHEAVYRHLWGDMVVEPNQLHHTKARLVRRLREAVADTPPSLVRAIPKRGFLLDLPPEQVTVLP